MSTEAKDIVLDFEDIANVMAVQFSNQGEWGNNVSPYTEIPYHNKFVQFEKDLTGRTIDQYDERYITPAVIFLSNEVLQDFDRFDQGRNEFLIKFIRPQLPVNAVDWRYVETDNKSALVSKIIEESMQLIRIDTAYRFIRRSRNVSSR